MLDFYGSTTVYLACGCTDLRKSCTGLAAIIKLKFHLDPYSRCMFAFCNRRRTLIKILPWDGSGFWILMKRLDRDSFHWPDTPDELQKVTLEELHWLCDGLSLNPSGAFEERHPKIVIRVRILSIRKKPKITLFWADFPPSRNAVSYRNGMLFLVYFLAEISES
ncbi:hypothetical protein ADH76_13095 [Enterocloster clostridioformis]|nr:hypothetical protein ADH76_13095 [Enterocloster clostridioformis]QQR03104.1 IS66 family insertion sequence element accessory protein TnpB [Enterocloster clostridioformis]